MKQPDELILLGNMDGFESANRVYSGGYCSDHQDTRRGPTLFINGDV